MSNANTGRYARPKGAIPRFNSVSQRRTQGGTPFSNPGGGQNHPLPEDYSKDKYFINPKNIFEINLRALPELVQRRLNQGLSQ